MMDGTDTDIRSSPSLHTVGKRLMRDVFLPYRGCPCRPARRKTP
jgi:hypothetical protein